MEKKYFFTTERARIAELDFFTVQSPALHGRADVCVYLPEGEHENIPVVILLHGVYGSHWVWSLKGQVHATLKELISNGQCKPMLLLMPSDGLYADGSAYAKHTTADYEKWIVDDCVQLAQENYPEVSASSPIFITGLSMGGYGALRLGAKYPDVFRAFSGLSSITDFDQFESFVQNFESLKSAVLHHENVLEILIAHKNTLAPFRFDCGSEDTLFQANLNLHIALKEENIPHEFYVNIGVHNWDYWTDHIKETLVFFNQYT